MEPLWQSSHIKLLTSWINQSKLIINESVHILRTDGCMYSGMVTTQAQGRCLEVVLKGAHLVYGHISPRATTMQIVFQLLTGLSLWMI